MRIACAGRQTEVVADGFECFLVAKHPDVADGGGGKHAQDSVGHGETSPKHGHQHEGTCRPRSRSGGQRCLDGLRQHFEIAQRLVGHKL